MIIAYTGMPGGGKTYALVWRAYKAIKEGRTVFANFPLKGTYQITLDDLCDYRFPENSVVLIDEAGRWFNSREWKDLPPEVFDMFTMHRHLQMDLYIGVQSFARVDKSLREVVELTYWARNSPILPFHRYEGFYDLEKLGSMKREPHVSHIVWKLKSLRNMYDTFSMKSKFAHKPMIPHRAWSRLDKRKSVVIKQKIRLFFKLQKRKLSRSLHAAKEKLKPLPSKIKYNIKEFIIGFKGERFDDE